MSAAESEQITENEQTNKGGKEHLHIYNCTTAAFDAIRIYEHKARELTK